MMASASVPRFVAGVAEHDTLIAGAARIDALGDVATAGRSRSAPRTSTVQNPTPHPYTDLFNRSAGNLGIVHLLRGRDLARDHAESGGKGRASRTPRGQSGHRPKRRPRQHRRSGPPTVGCPSVTDSDVMGGRSVTAKGSSRRTLNDGRPFPYDSTDHEKQSTPDQKEVGVL